MAGVNETPRQKMMGILYLVLLGLAATTITQQVLDAFRNLTVGLENSTNNVQSTIDATFTAFEKSKLVNEPERAKPAYEKANRVKAAIVAANKYINDTKNIFYTEVGGFDSVSGDVRRREDVDIVPRLMKNHKRADTLKTMIDNAIAAVKAELGADFKMPLNTNPPPKKEGIQISWQENYFGDGIPLTAALTALTKIQADLVNTEADVVQKLLNVDKALINVDQFSAIAVPTSPTYVLVGQPFTAEVYLTAFDSKGNPTMEVGGQSLKVDGGKGVYTVNTSREGEFKWSAKVTAKMADGKVNTYNTPEMTYRVAKPSAVVSPDKMNVFYIGVDNPVSVSAPGTPMEKLHVSIGEGATITGSNGKYVVNVKKAGRISVSVSAEVDKGKTSVLGSTEFRVKPLPTPHAKFMGKGGGNAPKAGLASTDKIFATLEDFDFDVKYNINHFTLYVLKLHGDLMTFEGTTNTLTAQMKAAINGARSGDKVMFDNVFATGPDGMRRPLDPITFTVQ